MIAADDVVVAYGGIDDDDCPSGAHAPALGGVSLRVDAGELVSVIGSNGSGKSTLARVLCGQLQPTSGTVEVDGVSLAPGAERLSVCELVGMVCQNPEDQLIASVVGEDVAFGPRNIGCSDEEVRVRVAHALEAVGLGGFEKRAVNELSGGEQQRLALAGVLALDVRYIVLDELTSMVDSAERPRLRRLVRELVERQGLGALQITHDPLEVLSSDRVVILDHGVVLWEGSPQRLIAEHRDLFDRLLLAGPSARVFAEAIARGYEPRTGFVPADIAQWAARCDSVDLMMRLCRGIEADDAARSSDARCSSGESGASAHGLPDIGGFALEARDVSHAYDGRTVLKDVNLALPAGRITLLAGRSGSGKSTLARILAGLERPVSGAVSIEGTAVHPGDVGLAFQNPEDQLFLADVRAELAFAPENQGLGEEQVKLRIEDAASALAMDQDFLDRDPFTLSGGQARRAALGAVLTVGARVLVLDEPTAGLDAAARVQLHEVVSKLARTGHAVMVISHDLEEWLAVADDALLMRDGSIVWRGSALDLAGDAAAFAAAALEPPGSTSLLAELERVAGTACAGDEAVPAVPQSAPRTYGLPRSAASKQHADASSRRLGEAPVARLDARAKIVSLFIVIIGIFSTSQLWAHAVWAIALGCAAAGAGVGFGRLVRSVRPVLLLLCFIVAANVISFDGSATYILAGPVGIDAAGGMRAATAVARIVLMLGFSLVVTATTDATQIADACVRLMRPLSALGAPVDELGIVLSLALRFIPLVSEELMRVRHAQEVRGVRFDDGSLFQRIGAWGSVLVPCVVGLFRRADRLGVAMDARCYASARRRPPAPRPWGWSGWLCAASAVALTLVLAVLGR